MSSGRDTTTWSRVERTFKVMKRDEGTTAAHIIAARKAPERPRDRLIELRDRGERDEQGEIVQSQESVGDINARYQRAHGAQGERVIVSCLTYSAQGERVIVSCLTYSADNGPVNQLRTIGGAQRHSQDTRSAGRCPFAQTATRTPARGRSVRPASRGPRAPSPRLVAGDPVARRTSRGCQGSREWPLDPRWCRASGDGPRSAGRRVRRCRTRAA